MTIPKLAVAASLLTLTNCAAALSQLTSGGKQTDDSEKYAYDNEKKWVDAAEQMSGDSMSELELKYDAWQNAYNYADQFLQRCSQLCKKADADEDKAEAKMIEAIEAAIALDPEPTTSFPFNAIIDMQRRDGGEKLGIDKSLAAVSDHWQVYWTKRLGKKGARHLVRELATGMCFFADGPQGKEVQPELVFGPQSEELYVRCITPEPLASYERTQPDGICLTIVTGIRGGDHVNNTHDVRCFHADAATTDTASVSVPVSAIMKEIKTNLEKPEAGFRNFTLDVSYVVSNKVGTVEKITTDNEVAVTDDIRENTVAHGYALFELDAKPRAQAEVAAAESAPAPRKHRKTRGH